MTPELRALKTPDKWGTCGICPNEIPPNTDTLILLNAVYHLEVDGAVVAHSANPFILCVGCKQYWKDSGGSSQIDELLEFFNVRFRLGCVAPEGHSVRITWCPAMFS